MRYHIKRRKGARGRWYADLYQGRRFIETLHFPNKQALERWRHPMRYAKRRSRR